MCCWKCVSVYAWAWWQWVREIDDGMSKMPAACIQLHRVYNGALFCAFFRTLSEEISIYVWKNYKNCKFLCPAFAHSCCQHFSLSSRHEHHTEQRTNEIYVVNFTLFYATYIFPLQNFMLWAIAVFTHSTRNCEYFLKKCWKN